MELAYYEPPHLARRVTATKAELFKDSIVLFNYTAQSLTDVRPRPFAQGALGVENHANVIDNILAGDLLKRPLADAPLLAITATVLLVLGLLFGVLVARLNAAWAWG